GFMGNIFPVIAMAFVGIVVVGMNYREMVRHEKLVLTTSVAIMIVGFAGILFGQGHIFTPAVAGVTTAALLAWKRPISRFALGLSDQELRSAILLAILTIIILTVLPSRPVDPWGLVEPRSNWVSVVIIAGMGFVNYILMKLLGPRGMEISAFFGGLVNSRKIIVELGTRLRQVGPALLPSVERGILLATGAMIIRNLLIVAILALSALKYCAIPLALMFLVNAFLWWRVPAPVSDTGGAPEFALESPFKLSAALMFGLMFLMLNVVGALAQRNFGSASFYFVSIVGGLFSSASSIASAATLTSNGELPMATGVNGVIFSSLTSILANIPFIRGLMKEDESKRKLTMALVVIAAAGLVGGVVNYLIFAHRLFER
ncbi:MAG TPA: DUF4010 domain-containing protein, partial [Thermodesulfobacteriota bacterium]|nr:DUF4010 domain-containing protein [Thermodesulfobacteriota bacterium]